MGYIARLKKTGDLISEKARRILWQEGSRYGWLVPRKFKGGAKVIAQISTFAQYHERAGWLT